MINKFDPLGAEVSVISDLLKSGRPERAYKRATKAAKKWPKVPALPKLAGLCAVQQQKFKLAQTNFERAWHLDPGNQELIQNYGLSLVQGGDSEDALRFIDKIGTRAPLTPAQLYIRAMALLREREVEKALAAVEQVLKHQPTHLQAQCLKADILDELRQWDQAIDLLTALVEQNPQFHYGQLRLAKAHVGMGRIDQAVIHARAALDLAPDDPETLEFMATLPNLSREDRSKLKARISHALEGKRPTGRESAAVVHFAAASLARQDKDTADEMQHLFEAHGFLREDLKEWQSRNDKQCRKILAAPLPVAALGPRTDIPRPIFVIGLPRSGTTLVERILSAHSGVQGLGELASVHHWARKAHAQPSEWQAADKLADHYVEHLPNLTEGAVAFVDKAPGNYAYIGAIAQAFPNAVILNVERDPRDVALSMWRTHFGAAGLYFTHDLKWMAAEANRYRRYVLHWQNLLPGRIHNIGYEHLVSNLKDTVEDLARICDLQFQEAMLSPHDLPDAVKTASNLQVRQPISASSVGRWQSVADHFKPFVKALDADLWPNLKAL
ncbi:tetratricopeptide repeat-containing sulfotransferase family protein [Ruegeria sp. EL01]|jgi:tetratricopeptide (TPR) repeat protein|uniref:tetratricopeptide repeat-containing sulfotransferase family protein n=1 Tax=Ruegeria sp. EL01 TaxID=2107578 RepID=UPI000EA827FE|nr:tetratricopeptide repeat-containing sulfotransferase family protein [Ruegeria sp. EL01]